MNDDIFFGSIITLIGAVISGVVMFFAGTNNIVWLAIVGFVLIGITLLISLFCHISNGLTNCLIFGLILILGLIFHDEVIGWGTKMAQEWLEGDSIRNLAYAARISTIAMVPIIIMQLVNINSSKD